MRDDYWLQQSANQPLFPDLLWSRPERRSAAGKLLIIGGSAHGFAVPAEAYSACQRAGIGVARVALPDAVRRLVEGPLETADFAPSTPSGSFSQHAVAPLLDNAAWADAVLFAGDLGRNSETAIVLETFLLKNRGAVILTKDAVDYIVSTPATAIQRPETLLVLSFSQLQRLGSATGRLRPLTFQMDLLRLVKWLHAFTIDYSLYVITQHLGVVFVAANGKVSTTKLVKPQPIWRVRIAGQAAVWWLQNPGKPFEALTTAVL